MHFDKTRPILIPRSIAVFLNAQCKIACHYDGYDGYNNHVLFALQECLKVFNAY